MVNDPQDIQDVPQDNGIEVSEGTPQIEIADTSTQEFWEEETSTPSSNQEPVIEQPIEESQEKEAVENNLVYKGDNQYISAIEKWASQNGYSDDIDVSKFDEKSFGKEQMNEAVGKLQAMKYMESKDPELFKVLEKGVPLSEYVEERMHFNSIMNMPDDQLVKGQMYNVIHQNKANLNVLKYNEDGSLTEESNQIIIDEVENHFNNFSSEQIKARSGQIRSGIQESINKLPDNLEAKLKQRHEKAVESFNQKRSEYITELNKKIDKSSALVVNFSDQSEKDEFKGYVDEMTKLTEIEQDGKKVTAVPLIHQLQNDSQMLLDVLRLLHMKKNGFFTDHVNSARKGAFDELGLSPVVGKQKGNKQGANTYKGVKIADTSKGWD